MTVNLKQIAIKKRYRIKKFKPIKTNEWLETEYYKYLRQIVNFIKQEYLKKVIPGMKSDKEKWQDESYSAKMDRLIKAVATEANTRFSNTELNK